MYCNYSKDKFGNEITFILPPWLPEKYLGHHDYETLLNNFRYILDSFTTEFDYEASTEFQFLTNLVSAENTYFFLLKNGWKPEQARNVLPLATKCDMIMTGFISDWQHFFDLRALGTTGKPHPQAKELAEPLMQEFIKRKYIN